MRELYFTVHTAKYETYKC